MELEMKYAVPSKETADQIWTAMTGSELCDPASAETLVMKAVYFDTEDGILSDNNVTFRVRAEGETTFATLKWGGSSSNGFHERQEINVPVNGETCFIQPPTDLFRESLEGLQLMELIKDRKLINLLEMRFLRRRARLTYNGTMMELAVDTGSIITDKGEIPILETELELFEQERSHLLWRREVDLGVSGQTFGFGLDFVHLQCESLAVFPELAGVDFHSGKLHFGKSAYERHLNPPVQVCSLPQLRGDIIVDLDL